MTTYTPYTYLIGWQEQNKWYYGLRYAKESKCLYTSGCHPDDLWKTYFTSSLYVKTMRELWGEPDVIQVRKTFKTSKEAQKYEERVLQKLKIYENSIWLNQGISGSYEMTEEVRRKMSASSKGPKSEIHKNNISKGRLGIVFTEEHKYNIRKARALQKPPTLESKESRRKIMSGLKWYNNGIGNCRKETHPGEGWVEGRLKGFKHKRDSKRYRK